MSKQRSPWTKKQQFIFGIIVIVVTLIASLTAILIVATKPYVDAEKKVIAIAESKADIKTVTEFDIYHGGLSVVEPPPKATELSRFAFAPVPIAMAFVTDVLSAAHVLIPVKAPATRFLESAPVPIAIPAFSRYRLKAERQEAGNAGSAA